MVMRYAHVNVGELQHTIDKLPGGEDGRQVHDTQNNEGVSNAYKIK